MEQSRAKRKAELRVANSIHDSLQMESTYIFDLQARDTKEQERLYEADVYMFIPSSLGVDSSNYSSDAFFRHLTSYFRIRTPSSTEWERAKPRDFRLRSLERYLAVHLETFERRKLAPRAVQEVKIFGNFVHTRLKKLEKRARKLGRTGAEQRAERVADTLRGLRHWVAILWAFRKRYVRELREKPLLIEHDVRRSLLLCDEYLSFRLELILIRVEEALPELTSPLGEILSRETEYRKAHDILCLEESPSGGKVFEAYTYRLGLLKKYMAEALYLKQSGAKKDHLYRNGVAAFGAACAATFAGLAEHQRLQYLTGNDSGVRLGVLIALAVVAYVFKDRIKDLTKEYFNNVIKALLPDRRWAVFYPFYDESGRKQKVDLGFVQEYVRFLKSPPEEVRYLRTFEKRRDIDPRRNEMVLHFSRRFDFNLRPYGQSDDVRYLKNVLRIDFAEFLHKLDNPTKPVRYYSLEEGAKLASAPKVYHINIVIRYRTTFGGAEAPEARRTDYERLRLVLNKRGLVRLEKVIKGGRLAHLEQLSGDSR